MCLLGRLQDCSEGSLVGGEQSKLPGAWENLRDSHPEEAKMRVSTLPRHYDVFQASLLGLSSLEGRWGWEGG